MARAQQYAVLLDEDCWKGKARTSSAKVVLSSFVVHFRALHL